MSTEVKKIGTGWYGIRDGEVVEQFSSNAAAWRWLDRQQGDFLSPREKAHDYGWRRYAGGANG